MSEDSIEIIAFHDNENVNVLNFAPTSPKSGRYIGGVNAIEKAMQDASAVLKKSLSLNAQASMSSTLQKVGSPKSLAASQDLSSKLLIESTKYPAWSHPINPTHSTTSNNRNENMGSPADNPVGEDVDEIMAFRANSSDSDGSDEAADSSQHQPVKPEPVPEDCLSIESLRVLPTIMEVHTQDTDDNNILSHEGTECASMKSTSSGDDGNDDDCIEVLDDGSISVGGMSSVEKVASLKSESSQCFSPKKSMNLKVAVTPDASEEIADLDQMLEDLNKDPCESPSPFSPLAGENILFSPRFGQEPITPRMNMTSPTSPRGILSPRKSLDATSPRGIQTAGDSVRVVSPRGVLSPRKSTDATSPRNALSPRHLKEEPSELASPRQRQDPPSLIMEVSEEVLNRRFSVQHAVAEANHLKHQLDEQMSKTQEFTNRVMAKRNAEMKRQQDLEKELKEVSRHNKELQDEIKKLDATKRDLQEAKLGVEKEEAELKLLREQHKAKCSALERELLAENQTLKEDIEKLTATKKELVDAEFKAQKEEAELATKKKEYEIQMQMLVAEKQKLGEAMDRATAETNETNELSKTVLKELNEHKKNVEMDMSIVREMHESRIKVLADEKVKLQAATAKAEEETSKAKENSARILKELEEILRKQESEVASLREEHADQMNRLEKEKEELANAMELAAAETTETKEMTRTVLSELEEYKVKLEMDMQTEVKDLKNEIRKMEEDHEKTMEKLVEKSEALQAEITQEQEEVQDMVKDMEKSIESLHQKKENMENELTLRIESVNESTKESKRELQQELNKARFSKAKSRFDKMRGHAKESLKCATVDMISYNVESFTQAAIEAITEPFSDDLLIKQAKSPEFQKKGTKKVNKQTSRFRHPPKQIKVISPRSQNQGISRQTSSSSLQGKIVSPREILL